MNLDADKPVRIDRAVARKIDLADWVAAIWKKRGVIADRTHVEEWLKTQDREHLEHLKASGQPIYRNSKLAPEDM